MKNYQFLYCILLIALSSCGANSKKEQSGNADSVVTESKSDTTGKQFFAEINIADTISVGDSVLLHFAVKNNTDSTKRFCKWHTPFEPLMSKYLDVKNEKGEEMNYLGAMAKRMMPPPESSYMSLKANDSIAINVDLLKGYDIKEPGKYTVSYSGENMSGLKVNNSASFVYIKK